jgi:lysophospholipase L1-like esterase
MREWQRYGLLALMGPVLWLQGVYVRKVTKRLPEPPGERCGIAGTGPQLCVLIVGDSAAAGVGSDSQEEALSGRLVEHLAQHYTVTWMLTAESGLDSNGMLDLLANTAADKFDVVVMSIGVNDVTGLMSPSKWLGLQSQLATEIKKRFEPTILIHSAVPPMERFTALPQPLRWFMGSWAREMNRLLKQSLHDSPNRLLYFPFLHRLPGGLASDGFHPGPLAYAVWGQGLSREIVGRLGNLPRSGQTTASKKTTATG